MCWWCHKTSVAIFSNIHPKRMRQGTDNTFSRRQYGRHFTGIFKWFFYENCWISIQTPLKFVSKVPIHNWPASVQIKAERRLDDESLGEPLLALFTTHICVIRPDWVKCSLIADSLLTSLSYSGVKIGYLDTISAVHAYSNYNKSNQTQR